MSPGLVFLLAMSIYPLLFALYMAFTNFNLLAAIEPTFQGIDNFARVLSNPRFWNSAQVTLIFVSLTVVLQLTFGFLLALVFLRGFRGDHLLRSLLILPMVMTPIVSGLLWRLMLNIEYGVVNHFIASIGLPRVDFFGSTTWALPTLIAIDIWQWTPFVFLILLPSLMSVSQEVVDAARVDGANGRQLMWHVYLPLVRYPLLVAALLRIIDSFRVYDTIFMTTRGGPIDATETFSWLIYDRGFRALDMPFAAATAWLVLILVTIVCMFLIRGLRSGTRGI
jgi:multiple sugar transport system permease protein